MPLTLFRWIHLVAASLWLGGLVFIIIVMRAPLQEFAGHSGSERSRALESMLVRFRRRYKGLLMATVAALVVSGIAALAVRQGRVNALYIVLLILKILASAGVMALFWYVAFVREAPRVRPSAPATTGTPADGEEDAAEQPLPSGQELADVDFFFRPKRQHALMQWWIVLATSALFLLGLIVAHVGTGLAERGTPAPAEHADAPEG